MLCDGCKEEPKPWQVFQVWQSLDACRGELSRLTILCGTCLVGETVPAYRPSIQRWHLGQVQAWRNVDTVAGEACLFFGGNINETEWVHLESAPFDAYTCHVRECHESQTLYDSRHDLETMASETTGLKDKENPDLQDIFRYSTLGSPASYSRGGRNQTPERGKNSTETADTSHHAHFAPRSPTCRNHTLLDCNSEDGQQSEEESSIQKACPRLWTIDEDRLLSRAVLESQYPLKWPEIAKLVPSRTGKQCRERYTNHLRPTLKLSEWSPVEDALVCRLHDSLGSKWATIARLLPGRTDNGIKNRFHHIRRKHDKEATRLGRNVQLEEQILKRTRNAVAPDPFMLSLVRGAADKPIADSAPGDTTAIPSSFGPFYVPAGVVCTRCNLFAPSRQTGNTVCEKTGWCEACAEAPVYLCGEVLRLQHILYDCARDVNRISLCSEQE